MGIYLDVVGDRVSGRLRPWARLMLIDFLKRWFTTRYLST